MSKQGVWRRAALTVTSLALTAAVFSAIPVPGGTAAAGLTDVRVEYGVDGAPVVYLSGDGGTFEHESFMLDGPYRLVVDLPGVNHRSETHRHGVDRGGVAQVRTAQFRDVPTPVTRVVFDLDEPLAYEIRQIGDDLGIFFGDPANHMVAGENDLPEWAREGRQTATETRSTWTETTQSAEPVVVAEDEPVDPFPTPEVETTTAQIQETMTETAETVEQTTTEVADAMEETVEEVVETTHSMETTTPVVEEPVIVENTVMEPVEVEEPVVAVASSAPSAITLPSNTPAPRATTTAVIPSTETPSTETTGATMASTATATPQPSTMPTTPPSQRPSRSVSGDTIDRLLRTPPAYATPTPQSNTDYTTRKITGETVTYRGKRISLNLTDADIKQVFRLFHEISGVNFVLDPSVNGRVTIVVDDVPWDQALDLILKNNGLDKVLENNVIRIATTQKLASEAAQRKQLKEAKELEVEPITITRTLSYAKARDVERVIREGGVLSQRGRVIVDERTNTLIVSDIPKKVEPLDVLISTLDSETPQVMIEARVVETSRDFVQDLGVVWGVGAVADASRGTQTSLGNVSGRYALNLPGAGGASNLAFKFSNIIDSFTLDIALNTLETEGRGRVLSSPKIATQNNERAEIEQGVRIPVVNTTATEINVEFVAASLRLEVTPQITAERTVILDIIVENNTPDFVNRVGDVPPINTQRAQTKVLIEDGGTTVIGGIFTVNEGQSETGVPWFRKIPVFGWLFKSTNVTRQNRELLIFITPKIMKLG